MENQIKIFEKNELTLINEKEILGKTVKIYGTIEEPLFLAKDVAEWIEYDLSSVNKLVNLVDDSEKVRKIVPTNSGKQEMWFLSEDGLYEILMQSRKPIAKEFKKKVKEILKTVRKNGGYVQDASQFINAYFPNMEQAGKDFLVMTLNEKLKSEKELAEQKRINKKQTKEIEYKEDIIIGLVKDIDLESKRQVLSTVMKHKNANYRERWQLLYNHFEKKYHFNLKIRRDNWDKENKPKSKSMIDYVDRGLNMIPEIYEIACKLFENDINEILEHYKNII